MTKRPLIGVTFDAEEPGGYAKFPWYALRQNYCSSIVDAGGIPIPLIHDLSLIESYLSLIDGLVVTGGDHDVTPALYGAHTSHPAVKLKPKRTQFEMAIVQSALKKNLPILGICGGHQLINVALGGTLIQHIPEEIPSGLNHEQPNPRSEPWHNIKIFKDTLLHKIIKTEELSVNSGHHQAIKEPGKGVVINAIAPDDIIEGFEVPAYRFCFGLQWHPEFIVTPQDAAIFKAFIAAAHE